MSKAYMSIDEINVAYPYKVSTTHLRTVAFCYERGWVLKWKTIVPNDRANIYVVVDRDNTSNIYGFGNAKDAVEFKLRFG